MAFGLLCKRCGCQESEHDFEGYGACEAYQSPDKRGEAAMWKADREGEVETEAFKRRGPAYEH